MVINPFLAPVTSHLRHVQVPTLDLGLTVMDDIHGPWTEGEWRHAGRTAQALLRATERGIDLPAVNLHRDATQRCDTVHDQKRVEFVAEFAKLLRGLPCSGGRLGMDNAQ